MTPGIFFYHHLFFRQKNKFSLSHRLFAQVSFKVVRSSSSNGYMQWGNFPFRPRNHVQFDVFEKNIGVRESQNSNSRNHKTAIFIDNVPFTLHSLVGLLHNSTTSGFSVFAQNKNMVFVIKNRLNKLQDREIFHKHCRTMIRKKTLCL